MEMNWEWLHSLRSLHQWKWHVGMSVHLTSRGGASEVSVATLHDWWCGWQLAIYVWYVRQALGLIALRACANGAESVIFEIYFYRERKHWKKKDLLIWSGFKPGSDAADNCLYHWATGALAALNFKLGSYSVQCWLQWAVGHQERNCKAKFKETQALQGILTYS